MHTLVHEHRAIALGRIELGFFQAPGKTAEDRGGHQDLERCGLELGEHHPCKSLGVGSPRTRDPIGILAAGGAVHHGGHLALEGVGHVSVVDQADLQLAERSPGLESTVTKRSETRNDLAM